MSFAGVSDELTGYTGTLSGAIGGFDGITFADATAMTLETAAADVSNTAWIFDVSARGTALAGTAILTWDNADFAGDTVTLNLAAGSNSEWSLVSAAAGTTYGTFDVQIDGTEIATGLSLNDQIADGDYAGWGFTLDDTVLKFKNLA